MKYFTGWFSFLEISAYRVLPSQAQQSCADCQVIYYEGAIPETHRALQNAKLTSASSYTYKRVITPGRSRGEGSSGFHLSKPGGGRVPMTLAVGARFPTTSSAGSMATQTCCGCRLKTQHGRLMRTESTRAVFLVRIFLPCHLTLLKRTGGILPRVQRVAFSKLIRR